MRVDLRVPLDELSESEAKLGVDRAAVIAGDYCVVLLAALSGGNRSGACGRRSRRGGGSAA